MVGNLVTSCKHAFVDVCEICARVEESSADGKKGYVNSSYGDGRDDTLSILRVAVINGEREGVRARAGENLGGSCELAGDKKASWDGLDDFDEGELEKTVEVVV